ncbi:hypothetical protein [Streptomyces sp. RG80]|uniref:hypothetical protein n=1 Tax=Streptomyces sp. RG80 TaxID=3157340 RepID=UPI00338E0A90
MTRWLRTVRTTGLLLALGAGPVGAPWGAGTSHGAESVPGVRGVEAVVAGSATPAAEPSRAGSRAGEGRERPGRREEAEADVGNEDEAARPSDGAATVVPSPTREAVSAVPVPPERAARQAVGDAERPAARVLRIVPLGSGLLLMGLGLGLAFVGLRVRRG